MPRTSRRLLPVAALILTSALGACRFGYGAVGAGGGASSSGAGGDVGTSGGGGDLSNGGTDPDGGASAGLAGIDETAGLPEGAGSGGVSGSSGAGSSSGAGGGGGASGVAGKGGSGGSAGKGGSAGTGGVDLEHLVVTTTADEADTGANPSSPGKTGFSLREAISFANAQSGHQSITFDASVTTIGLKSPLPVVQETLDITGAVVLDASANTSTSACLSVASSDVHLDQLEIHDCGGEPVLFSSGTSTGNQLTNSYIHDNKKAVVISGDGAIMTNCLITFSGAAGVDVYGKNAQLQGNDVAASIGTNYAIHDGANGAYLLANVSIGGGDGIGLGAVAGITIWHSTIVDSVFAGLNAATASQVDARNNIFIGADTYGVRGADSAFSKLDHNLYFNNTSGNRNSGSLDATSIIGDPLFNDPTNFDYSLKTGSPAINKGFNLGVDRNGSTAGSYNGSAPDIGWSESP